MIRSLFEEIAKPSHLAPLGLIGLLDRTGEALGRVDRTAFFSSFDTDQAVQHFYEPFLQAFDPILRKELGVWRLIPLSQVVPHLAFEERRTRSGAGAGILREA
jgi:hypothetical protein